MTQIQAFDRLFNPSSLAIIGASRGGQRGGGFLLKGLIRSGFEGKLYPVNPNETEIMGLKSYPSVLDIPGEVDVAIIAVSAKIVPQIMTECVQKSVKFAVIHSAGFSEIGAQGMELEKEVLRIAQQGGIHVIGPNCMGLYCPQVGFNTIVPESNLKNEAGQVGFLGQSGWISENFVLMGYERGLRFSKVISIGNQSDLTIEDFLEYFAADAETRVIACYVEGVKRGREFLQLAKQISQNKPMIVWKGGRTEAGFKAAASHTGALAGNAVVFDAALKQSGVVSAENLENLIDLVVGFTCPVMPSGNKLGVVAEAGGGAVAIADICQTLGLEMPVLPVETQEQLTDILKGVMPSLPRRQNPVDMVWTPFGREAQIALKCTRTILEYVDMALVISYAPLNERFATELVSLRDGLGKPIFIVPGHPVGQKRGIGLLAKRGIPTFTIPERALKVLSSMVRYSKYLGQSG